MRKIAKSWVVFGVIAALIAVPFATSALAQEYFETREPGGDAMMYDMIVIALQTDATRVVTYRQPVCSLLTGMGMTLKAHSLSSDGPDPPCTP